MEIPNEMKKIGKNKSRTGTVNRFNGRTSWMPASMIQAMNAPRISDRPNTMPIPVKK